MFSLFDLGAMGEHGAPGNPGNHSIMHFNVFLSLWYMVLINSLFITRL